MAEDTLETAESFDDFNDEEASIETWVVLLVDLVERRSIARASQLPSPDQLIADSGNTKQTLTEQIVLICNKFRDKIPNNDEESSTEATARKRVQWFLDHQDEVAGWTRDALVHEIVARLNDYLQILRKKSHSEAERPIDAIVDHD